MQTSQGQTTAWVSVVDFNGNWSQFHEHEAVINAQEEIGWRKRLRRQGTVYPVGGRLIPMNHPIMGCTFFWRANKQPRNADKDLSQQYLDDSTDLLGLHGGNDASSAGSGIIDENQEKPPGLPETTNTGRTCVAR